MAAFTEKTNFAPSKDAMPALPYSYTDMRGHQWLIAQSGFGDDAEWHAYPGPEAAKAYDGLSTATWFVAVYGPNSAKRTIQSIESKLEEAIARGETPGAYYERNGQGSDTRNAIPWWVIVLGLYALSKHKGR